MENLLQLYAYRIKNSYGDDPDDLNICLEEVAETHTKESMRKEYKFNANAKTLLTTMQINAERTDTATQTVIEIAAHVLTSLLLSLVVVCCLTASNHFVQCAVGHGRRHTLHRKPGRFDCCNQSYFG